MLLIIYHKTYVRDQDYYSITIKIYLQQTVVINELLEYFWTISSRLRYSNNSIEKLS